MYHRPARKMMPSAGFSLMNAFVRSARRPHKSIKVVQVNPNMMLDITEQDLQCLSVSTSAWKMLVRQRPPKATPESGNAAGKIIIPCKFIQ
jgi:hypothetical protein